MYFQYMCGEVRIAAGAPCEASELVYFRKRIGESGIELILKESIRINQDDAQDDDVIVDTTVQEKNITFPTDDKMFKKSSERVGKLLRSTTSNCASSTVAKQRF